MLRPFLMNWNANKVFGPMPVWKTSFDWLLTMHGMGTPIGTGGTLLRRGKYTVLKTAILQTGRLPHGQTLPP